MTTTQTANPRPSTTDTAILFATWSPGAEDDPLGTQNILLPLLDRPMLQCVVERLVRHGCTTLHVVLGDDPRPVKALLGDGTRWGCRIVWHQTVADEDFMGIMRRIGVRAEEDYVLAVASRMPLGDDSWPARHGTAPSGRIDAWDGDGTAHWSGWGIFAGDWLLTRSISASFTSFERAALQDLTVARRYRPRPLSSEGPAEVLDSALRMLTAEPVRMRPGRGCEIHPSARLVEPVLIGQGVKIGADAVVGPNVVLGDGAFLDRGVQVRDSIVLPESYVGEGLELTDAVVRGKRLANVRLNTVIQVPDSHILAWIPATVAGMLAPVRAEKVMAAVLRVVLAPLHHLARALDPAAAPLAGAKRPYIAHFRRTFYPGLHAVMAGQVHLLGPAKRASAEDGPETELWRSLHPDARYGLLNDSLLQSPSAATPEAVIASDLMACALQRQPREAVRMVWRYLLCVVKDFGPRAPAMSTGGR